MNAAGKRRIGNAIGLKVITVMAIRAVPLVARNHGWRRTSPIAVTAATARNALATAMAPDLWPGSPSLPANHTTLPITTAQQPTNAAATAAVRTPIVPARGSTIDLTILQRRTNRIAKLNRSSEAFDGFVAAVREFLARH
jgi:hypothetical protein